MNQQIQATVKTVTCYEVTVCGESLGTFTEKSTWNGFVEMKGEAGVLIMHRSFIDETFSSMFGMTFNSPIVAASPDLMQKIRELLTKSVSKPGDGSPVWAAQATSELM